MDNIAITDKCRLFVEAGHHPTADEMFEIVDELQRVYGAKRAAVVIETENGARITFEIDDALRQRQEREETE
jgi:hypothetical protein